MAGVGAGAGAVAVAGGAATFIVCKALFIILRAFLLPASASASASARTLYDSLGGSFLVEDIL